MPEIHDAAKNADVARTRELLSEGADVNERDERGFTPLHRAATAGEHAEDPQQVVDTLNVLVANGANLEDVEPAAGRTPLYLAVEFSHTVEPVQALIDAGASLEFDGVLGENLIDNAWCDATKELLTQLTGRRATEPLPEPPSARLGRKDWAKAQSVLDVLFERLNEANIIAIQDCGTTQEDALADCGEVYRDQLAAGKQPIGICFYTRQDLKRAKRSAQLNIGIWGADEGGVEETLAIGQKLRDEAESLELPIHWNDRPDTRPVILLSHFKN